MQHFSGGISVASIMSMKALNDFIIHFNLRHPNAEMFFYAKVEFNISDHKVTKLCQVEIGSSEDPDTIHLIDPTIDPFFLPDTFQTSTDQFMYIPQKGLAVYGAKNEKFGEYNVFIFP